MGEFTLPNLDPWNVAYYIPWGISTSAAPLRRHKDRSCWGGSVSVIAVDVDAHLVYRVFIHWPACSHILMFISTNVLINTEPCKRFPLYFQIFTIYEYIFMQDSEI